VLPIFEREGCFAERAGADPNGKERNCANPTRVISVQERLRFRTLSLPVGVIVESSSTGEASCGSERGHAFR